MIIYSPNPTFVPSLSEIGDLSCITSYLVLPGFLMDTLLNNVLRANTEKNLFAKATDKRKREIGLVVPARFSAVTTELHIAEVLEREVSSEVMKYSHFELNNISIEKNKIPRLT